MSFMSSSVFDKLMLSDRVVWRLLRIALLFGPPLLGMLLALTMFLDAWHPLGELE